MGHGVDIPIFLPVAHESGTSEYRQQGRAWAFPTGGSAHAIELRPLARTCSPRVALHPRLGRRHRARIELHMFVGSEVARSVKMAVHV